MKSTFKRSISLFLSLALAFSLMTVGASAEEFADMPNGWSKEAMASAVENGLLRGNNGKLDPTGLLTRAQLATVIVRAFGAATEADLSLFIDIKAEDWYYSALAKAKGMAVMTGTSDSTMSPDHPISRQEVFVILARALKLADGKAEVLNAYKDAESVGAWAVGGTAALVSAGYISGSDGCLLPTDNITREQFAQILYNIFGTYYQAAGVYTEDVNGSLLVNVPDVTIKNAKITGDLVVGDGVGEGDLTLENVSIGGRLVVRGGGVNSIHIKGSSIGSVVIGKENGAIRVVADSASKVEYINIADGKDDVIIEGKVDTIAVENEAVPVILKNATVDTLHVNGDNAEISLVGSTKVSTLAVAEDTKGVKLDKEKSTMVGTLNTESDLTVTGDGKISNITGSGKPTNENGGEVKPTTQPTGGSGGGHRHTYAAEWTTDDNYHWHAATCSHTDLQGSYAAHDYTTLVSDTATCTDGGMRVMSCVCGKTVEQPSSPKGHSFAEGWNKDTTHHWHAATCSHTDLQGDYALHSYDTNTNKCVCGAVKPTTPDTPVTGNYSLSYEANSNGGIVVRSNIPTTSGKYRLKFSGNGTSYETGIGSSDYSTYPLDVMFAGDPATTYTKLEWTETLNNKTTTIATLNKSLTVAYSGDVLGINNFSAVRNSEIDSYEAWDMEISVDGTLESSASYMLYHYVDANGGSGCTSLNVENGKLVSTNGSSQYAAGNTVTLHVLKVTGTVDGSGNATLTYTPMGNGYKWIVPSESSGTPQQVSAIKGLSLSNQNGQLKLTIVKPDSETGIDRYRVYLSKDSGTTWIEFSPISTGRDWTSLLCNELQTGTYNKIKVVSTPETNSNYTKNEYVADCSITVNVSTDSTAEATFVRGSEEGREYNYFVNITGLSYEAGKAKWWDITFTDNANNPSSYGSDGGSMDAANASTNGSADFCMSYHKIREYSVTFNGANATVDVKETAWRANNLGT